MGSSCGKTVEAHVVKLLAHLLPCQGQAGFHGVRADGERFGNLGMSLNDYYKILQDNSYHKVLSFEDMGTGDDSMLDNMSDGGPGILDGLQREDMQRIVTEAIASLPERERLVMALYYDEELNLREIGAVMGVSESRVSQIHSQAVIRLQARMTNRSE